LLLLPGGRDCPPRSFTSPSDASLRSSCWAAALRSSRNSRSSFSATSLRSFAGKCDGPCVAPPIAPSLPRRAGCSAAALEFVLRHAGHPRALAPAAGGPSALGLSADRRRARWLGHKRLGDDGAQAPARGGHWP